jgi:ribosomal protein L32
MGRKARDYEGNIFYMFLIVFLLMLPGILFAGLLGWRVARDAAIIGLSHKARRFWLAGTLIFGLPAYITYRLTRPKVTLVTCANCGKPRRPDTDICHCCGSKWDVPELTPPTWRVLNEP